MTPAAFIHARRKALGMNIFDLAYLAEITSQRLRAIEDGNRPDHHEAERIAAAIGDDFDVLADLLDGRTDIRLCSNCGCHEHAACIDGHGRPCGWASESLCTHCADPSHAILAFDPEARRYFTHAAVL